MSAALLSASGLSGGYGADDAIRDVSLHVAEHEVVFLLGPNGAGKTTLLRALSGTLPRCSGTVALAGEALERRGPHIRARRGLVHVAEGRSTLIPSFTVREHLDLVARNASELRSQLTERFPLLRERQGQQVGTMSGGQQQLVALALGLLAEPRCLLIDEPSAGLSPVMVEEVLAVLEGLRSDGVAMLIAEQRVDLALALANRAYTVEAGGIGAEGTVEELIAGGELDATYLGVAPSVEVADA